MKAQELLRTSLNNLLIVQDGSVNLTLAQAMDLHGAIERVSDILKGLEKKGKDWEVAELEQFIETCQ
jgi:hypothetical protein